MNFHPVSGWEEIALVSAYFSDFWHMYACIFFKKIKLENNEESKHNVIMAKDLR